MSLFKTKLNLNVKFFYPWETIDNIEIGGYSLVEEVSELMWNNDWCERIEEILKRYNVKDWDFEEDSDDYISVTFKDNIDSDSLHHDIDTINSQLAYLWQKLVLEARNNLRDYEFENQREQEEYEERHDIPKSYTPPANIWNANAPLEKEKDEWNVWNR